MNDELWLSGVISEWQGHLLQLDRRNNLLYFKPGKRAVQITNMSPDQLADRLERARSGLRFPYAERAPRRLQARLPFTADDPSPVDSEPEDVRVWPGDLEVDVSVEELQRRLTQLARAAREWEEEQGVSVLFLAVGMLTWIDEDGEEARAPLLLLPCRLTRASPRDPYYLQRDGDDTLSNATLQHKLREMGIVLPEPGEDDLASYLQTVSDRIADRQGWHVSPDIVLNIFAYSKLAMWEDLERMRTGGIQHPFIIQLAGQLVEQGDTPEPSPAIPEDGQLAGGKLDDILDIRNQFTVLEADFSQLRAIEAARAGGHLVIHGPPGTGKSQTIANIIATLLADGKQVLFVSEKTAALDVVKRKLEECGLGIFCLDLHGDRATKASVYDQMNRSLVEPQASTDPGLSLDALMKRRDQLNRFVRALHEPRRPLGRTVFQVQGEYAHLQRFPQVEFPISNVASLDEDRLNRIRSVCDRIARRTEEFRDHATSRWLPLTVQIHSLQLPDLIRSDMEHVQEALRRLADVCERHATWLGLPRPEQLTEVERLASVLAHLAKLDGRGVPAHWLSRPALESLTHLVAEQVPFQARIRELRTHVRETFGEPHPELDYRNAAAGANLNPGEEAALQRLFGDTWSSYIIPALRARVEQVEAIGRSLQQLRTDAEALAAALGGVPVQTWTDVDRAISLATRIVQLAPVPEAWFSEGGRTQARALVAEAERLQRDLATILAALRQTFADDILDVVDQEMARRFRLDYQSRWQRLRGRYRADMRRLRACLHEPRKLSLAEASRGVYLASTVHRFRREWTDLASRLPGFLGDRFAGPETDWAAVQQDIQETGAVLDEWPGDWETVHRLLTTRHPAIGLRELVRRTADSLAHCRDNLERLPPSDLTHPSTAIDDAQARAEDAQNVLRKLDRHVREVIDAFRKPPGHLDDVRNALASVLSLQDLEQELAAAAPRLRDEIGHRFAGLETDWEDVSTALHWTREYLDYLPEQVTAGTRDHATSPLPAGRYEAAAQEVRTALTTFTAEVGVLNTRFDASKTPWGSWTAAAFQDLQQWARDLHEHAESAATWLEYQSAVRDLEDELGPGLVDRLRLRTDRSEEVPGIVLRRVYAAWLDHVYQREPVLREFNAKDHEAVRQEFRDLDRRFFAAARQRVRERCLARYPARSATDVRAGQLGILRGELSKKRRRMPVRRLFMRAPQIVQALKPCFLMSPLAVSQYLPRGETPGETLDFDTVIFDEASQVFPEDAVPAIARARQTIVVGDQQQLPPTSFFRKLDRDEDEEDEDEIETSERPQNQLQDRESILDVMVGLVNRGVDEHYLCVHYRSRHESLISFSNHFFYGNRLLTFPSPDRSCRRLGIRDVYLPDARYDAGRTRTNRGEAEAVVDLVFQLFRTLPANESLGVVALSRPQAELIQQLVEARRLTETDVEDRFAEDRREPFFVKNLENVQGDERDHIILDIGYGPTVGSGAVPNRFGPINAEHGDRRLNVAVSRARKTLTLVHSLRPTDIRSETKGARLLRRYLEYAQDPLRFFEAERVVDPGAEPESPFEEAVLQALQARGYRVQPQVQAAGYRIDLAILDNEGEPLLGIECDGAAYHGSPTARDRDWLRQQILEGLGWRIHRIWSTSWIRNPEAELAAVDRAVEAAKTVRALAADGHGSDTYTTGDAPTLRHEPAGDGVRTEAGPVPESRPARLFAEYREASLGDIKVGPELQHETTRTLENLVTRVVQVEGPVHLDVVVERIRDRYGVRRAGSVIRQRIEGAVRNLVKAGRVRWEMVRHSEVRTVQSPFLSLADAPHSAQPRCPGPGQGPRRIEHVSDVELEAGLLLVARHLYGGTRDELVVETARQFGYQRTGAGIAQRLQEVVDRLLAQRRLVQQFTTLSLAEGDRTL